MLTKPNLLISRQTMYIPIVATLFLVLTSVTAGTAGKCSCAGASAADSRVACNRATFVWGQGCDQPGCCVNSGPEKEAFSAACRQAGYNLGSCFECTKC